VKVKALNKRVIIEPFAADEVSEGGIILSATTEEAPVDGIVRSVAQDCIQVDEGNHVLYPKYSGTEIVVDDTLYRIMLEEDLLGVFVSEEDDE